MEENLEQKKRELEKELERELEGLKPLPEKSPIFHSGDISSEKKVIFFEEDQDWFPIAVFKKKVYSPLLKWLVKKEIVKTETQGKIFLLILFLVVLAGLLFLFYRISIDSVPGTYDSNLKVETR